VRTYNGKSTSIPNRSTLNRQVAFEAQVDTSPPTSPWLSWYSCCCRGQIERPGYLALAYASSAACKALSLPFNLFLSLPSRFSTCQAARVKAAHEHTPLVPLARPSHCLATLSFCCPPSFSTWANRKILSLAENSSKKDTVGKKGIYNCNCVQENGHNLVARSPCLVHFPF